MEPSKFDEFLTEKQKLEEFLQKLEIELNTCLEDFEKVNLDKLQELNEMIKDNAPYALVIDDEFTNDFFKFSNEFNHYVSYFNELKRFNLEVTLERFLDTIQLLRKDLYK